MQPGEMITLYGLTAEKVARAAGLPPKTMQGANELRGG